MYRVHDGRHDAVERGVGQAPSLATGSSDDVIVLGEIHDADGGRRSADGRRACGAPCAMGSPSVRHEEERGTPESRCLSCLSYRLHSTVIPYTRAARAYTQATIAHQAHSTGQHFTRACKRCVSCAQRSSQLPKPFGVRIGTWMCNVSHMLVICCVSTRHGICTIAYIA